MTAPSLKSNFRGFGPYLGWKLRSQRTLTILNSIFALLSYPATLLAILPMAHTSVKLSDMRESIEEYWTKAEYIRLQELNDLYSSIAGAAIFICVLMLVALFVMSYVVPAKSFRWLYDKTVVDMDYSLPVSDDTRFFGDLLASVISSLVPHALAIGAGAGLYWLLPFAEADREGVGYAFDMLFGLAATGFVSCVMFMGGTLLVMSLCARRLEAWIMPLAASGLATMVHYICILLMTNGMYGGQGGSTFEYSGAAVTSPLGLLANSVLYLTNSDFENGRGTILLYNNPWVAAGVILVTLGCFAGAYFLAKHRRAERVGGAYAFRRARFIIPSAAMFAIALVACVLVLPQGGDMRDLDFEAVVSVGIILLIVSFIIYIILELISGKGFKAFHKTLGRYVLTMACCLALCLGIYFAGGAFLSYFTPPAQSVESVHISIHGGTDYETLESSSFDTDDRECIENTVEVHRRIAGERKDVISYQNYLSIDYELTDGTMLRRLYYLSDAQYVYAKSRIVTPGSYYDYALSGIGLYMLNAEEQGDKCIIDRVVFGSSWADINLPMEELKKALREDCDAVTDEELLSEDGSIRLKLMLTRHSQLNGVWQESSSSSHELVLQPWCKNTIALLNKYAGEDVAAPADGNSVTMVFKVPVDDLLDNGRMNVEKLYMDCAKGYEMGYSVYGDSTVRPLERIWDYREPVESYSDLFDLQYDSALDPDYGEIYDASYVYFLICFKDIDREGMNEASMEDALFVREGWHYTAEEHFIDRP